MPYGQFTTTELANEIWKQIPGFEGYYSASDIGRIRRDSGGPGWHAGHILRPHLFKGYLRLMLTVDGKRTRRFVHQFIALTFIGRCPQGHTVNHIDPKTGKTNNRATNLEYRTPQGQTDHAKEHGLLATGSRNGRSTHPETIPRGDTHYKRTNPEKIARGATLNHSNLTDDKVREIKQMLHCGAKGVDIAVRFNVTPANISAINTGKIWTHIHLKPVSDLKY